MVLQIQLGLLKIPIMVENFSNNRSASSSLHQFSMCCKDSVGIKNYCKGCGKEVTRAEILKGTDKNTILSQAQQDALKEALEGGIMEVLGIQDITETTTYDILPYVVKAQAILPSISKGYKKTDIKTFYSFKASLKELNKFCIVKLTQRACEHIGVMLIWKEDLVFIELPFKHYSNISEIERLKELVVQTIKDEKISDTEAFKEQAGQFISTYKSKVNSVSEVKEEKKILLKAFIEDIEKGITPAETISISEKNPFAV
jgi:non-homologous end joining protein Ku